MAAALALVLGGCGTVTVPRAGQVAVDLPAAWSEVAASSANGGATGSGAVLSPQSEGGPAWRLDDALLDRLLVEAAEANTSIQSAQGALRQARALREVAAASLWPAVNGSAGAQRGRIGRSDSIDTFTVGLDASWTLDIFGAQRDAVAASEASARAAAESLDSMRANIATELTLAYVGLRSAQERRAIAVDNLASQQNTLQITRWRVQAGLLSDLEGHQAVAAAEQAAALLPAWQTLIEQTAFALSVLTGRPPAALLASLTPVGSLPALPDDPANGVPADTVRNRPDVRAAEQQVSAGMASLARAEAARWPTLSLSGSLGLSALTLGALGSAAALVRSLAAQVGVPVLDGGAAAAEVRVQRAALDQARVAWQAVVLAALKDVENARAALRGDREQLLRLEAAAVAATQAATLARQRYAGGLVDYQTVLETQRTHLATQDGVAAAQAGVTADQVRLAAALGMGWRGPAGGPPSQTETARTTPS